jgi:hypothetical protein
MVTPNYIRMYAQGNFPDNTLMIMNTCSSYNKDMSSPMKNLLFEKSGQGARFLGWNGKALVSGMGRTALNLFQLMTASNEELTVKNLKALEKSTPPQGGEFTALERALDELKQKSYLTDPKTGATLELSKQGSENTDLILMPHPLDIYRSSSNDPFEMTLYCANKPTSTIDSTEVSLENIVGTGWKLSVPVTAYGDLVITDGERESIPRPIYRWKPQFKIKYTGANYGAMPFMQLNGTLTLQARAGMGSCFRDSVWNDPPTAVFDAPWDLEVSTIGWSISGAGKDEGGNNYQYSGSDIATLKAKNGTGSMWSYDGETLSLQVCCDDLKYNLTLKAADGTVGSFDSSTNMCATIFYKSDVLSDDWSVEKGSYHDDIYELQIDWNAFSPEPLFDEENEPR